MQIISVGKKHEPWVIEGIERYQKRLQRPFTIEWVLSPSGLNGNEARRDESERILSRLTTRDYVILLDERGQLLDSPGLARALERPLESSQPVVLIIGGAFGVDQSVHDRANLAWSLSPLVFPHQLVRLVLSEQIYRAQEISAGRPYHHQ